MFQELLGVTQLYSFTLSIKTFLGKNYETSDPEKFMSEDQSVNANEPSQNSQFREYLNYLITGKENKSPKIKHKPAQDAPDKVAESLAEGVSFLVILLCVTLIFFLFISIVDIEYREGFKFFKSIINFWFAIISFIFNLLKNFIRCFYYHDI